MKTHITIINFMLAVAVGAIENNSSVDSGGARSTNAVAAYSNDGCIGGISGIASTNEITARSGYVGQLTETTSLTVTANPGTMSESATTQLSGSAVMDDDSVTSLTGSEIHWDAPASPLTDISASGLASACLVYEDTAVTINGSYLDVEGNGSVLVQDTDADNFGSYAGDGLPDSWQYQYFGLDNPNAAPDKDLTGVGQNNMFKYVAGLDPTNPFSVFEYKIVSVPGQPNQKQLVFSPCFADRTYTILTSTNLEADQWIELADGIPSGEGNERSVIDPDAVENRMFYRIQINKQ